MSKTNVHIWWVRLDLRLDDNPALAAAAEGAVVPVFIYDDMAHALGAAAKWRLHAGLSALSGQLTAKGSRLIIRKGDAAKVLLQVAQEVGAGAVHWERYLSPDSIIRDTSVKSILRENGVAAHSHQANLLTEPWHISTKTGGAYAVFTPFWKRLLQEHVAHPYQEPKLTPPSVWPASAGVQDLRLRSPMQRGAAVLDRFGPQAGGAAGRLAAFGDTRLTGYSQSRDDMGGMGTSDLSSDLAFGEVGVRRIWHGFQDRPGAQSFLRQLAWRDFAYHLLFHTPHIETRNWRDGWDRFPWTTDPANPGLIAWQRGQTGVDIVDAAMRELFVTGRMHNRARMIVASYLTKHLLVDWRLGAAWFADTLVDWDPANNAMGWQWVAGCGPDAAPFFRIFNPDLQAQKFDPKSIYRNRWLDPSSPAAQAFFEAAPRSWALKNTAQRSQPLLSLKAGRDRALTAYEQMRNAPVA